MKSAAEIRKYFEEAFGKPIADNFFNDFFGAGFDTSVDGKRAVKYGKPWLLLARVHGNLYLACEGKTKPPTPVMLIRLQPDEILDI